MEQSAESWGRYPKARQQLLRLTNRHAPLPETTGSLLPRGNGRSYGDSCLNPDGTLLLADGLDRFIAFDPATGVLRAEAGTTLEAVINLVLPHGWFLPVTPGTRFATLGGALANDVHGKNHHRAGSFGHHVLRFELLRSDGDRRICVPGADGLFAATLGGLGLTGLVTWIELALARVPGNCLDVESIRFGALDEFFALSRESEPTHAYTVAWVDCLASGRKLGRGHFLRANHRAGGDVRAPARRLSVPFVPPVSPVNRFTLRGFNWLYYNRQLARTRRSTQHYLPFFYPLDGIAHWNRAYGPRGFLQHQCVLPPAHAREGMAALLGEIARSGQGSFLAVLKEFGTIPSRGLLSFPRPGTTLALDFPNSGPGTFALLDRLDAVVHELGGAVYPAKDARMSGAHFRQAYPRWTSMLEHIDPAISSGFWRRVME